MTSRRIPYGKRIDSLGRIVKDAKEYAGVRFILSSHHEMGFGPEAIAKQLNEYGIPSKRGGKWHASTVRNVLNAYKGIPYKSAVKTIKGGGGAPLAFPKPPSHEISPEEQARFTRIFRDLEKVRASTVRSMSQVIGRSPLILKLR